MCGPYLANGPVLDQDFAEELRLRGGAAVDAGVICSSEEEALKVIDAIGGAWKFSQGHGLDEIKG